MEKKYKTEPDSESELLRIIALKDFSNVNKGDKGGLIKSESNLSQEGDCWVYDNARVFDNAKVYGSACIYENAMVFGDAQVSGRVRVHDNAGVCGSVRVYDDIDICGKDIIDEYSIKVWFRRLRGYHS